MNKFENARYNADNRVKDFMVANDTALSTMPLYADEKNKFDDGMTRLDAALQLQTKQTDVITENKAALKMEMAEIIHEFALRCSVQAHQLGDSELALALGKPLSYLLKSVDTRAFKRATEQKELMKNNISTLTVIAAVDIAKMEAVIAAFTLIKDRAREEIRHIKAEGTDLIKSTLNELDFYKDNIGKLIHSFLPELSAYWDAEARVGLPSGRRHLSIAMHFSDADNKAHLRNVISTASDGITTVVRKSTYRGWVRFYSLESGNWTVTSERKTYETDLQVNVLVDEGVCSRFNIAMKKKNNEIEPEVKTGILDMLVYDKDTGNPLAGVKYSMPALMIVDTTDEDGEGYEDLLDPGTYTGSLYMEGYKDLPFTFAIKAGETTTLQLKMEKTV
jgi:hypothetical protein